MTSYSLRLTLLYYGTYPDLVGCHSPLILPMVSKVTPPEVIPQGTTPLAQADQVSRPETLTLYSLVWFLCGQKTQRTSELFKTIVHYSFLVIIKCKLFDEFCSSRVQGATGYYTTQELRITRFYKTLSHRC